jgi:hypothetical protein
MTISGDKPDDMVVENLIHEASENVFAAEGDAVASSSGSAPHEGPAASDTDTVHSVIDDGSLRPLATLSPENDSFATERAEQEAVLAAAARDQQSTAPVTADASTEATSSAHVSAPEVVSSVSEVAPQSLTQSEVKLPVGHTYYFIQMFDADNQVLRTVGSFFSKLDSNVKASIRRHLQRPLRQDFLVWKRVDGATVTTVSPADSFDDVVAPHGACFIVGDKLTKDK